MNFFSLLALLLTVLFLASPAQAHFLSVDRTVGATIHIDPNDAPAANQPSTIFFDIADKSGHFKLENCDCRITISKAGHQLLDQKIGVNGVVYTFPQIDVYSVRLTGSPKEAAQFHTFDIGWNIRADHLAGAAAVAGNLTKNQTLGGIIFTGVLVLTISFFVFKRRSG